MIPVKRSAAEPQAAKNTPSDAFSEAAERHGVRKNKVKYIAAEVLNCFTYLFVGGALWQGLLLYIGCTADKIGTLSGIGYATQTLSMGLGLILCDRLKKPIRAMALCDLPISLFFFSILFFLCVGSAEEQIVFPILAGLVIVYYAAFGFKTILAYKIPYLIIHMEDYGKLLGRSGFVSNLFVIAVSVGLPGFLSLAGYLTGMRLMYAVCALFALAVSLLDFRLKALWNAENQASVSVRALFSERNVLRLAPANFLRGLSSGVIISLTVMASKLFCLDSVGLSLLVSLTSLGSVVGNFIYSFAGKASKLSRLCLSASLVMLVLGSASVLVGSWRSFTVLFVVIQIAYVIVNGTIPVLFARLIPYSIAGGCTALRMMETMLGTAISSWFTGLVLENFDGRLTAFLLMLAAGAAQTICGLFYYRFCRAADRQESHAVRS